ncbi:MAG: trypsin-like peptidase domain-containing protein [Planctomycetes bacterium]|nr:trypsin-like peptidase domain-containing protein [Planctomycetota bacterium]
MRAQLLHLSGPLRGRTVTYPERMLRVGAAPGSEVRMIADGVVDRHAQIDWVQAECQFHLRRLDGPVFVNGTEVEEVILADDDLIEFGAGGPMARFRIYVPIGAVCKPVRRMLADARDVAVHSDGVAATQTLTRDLLTQATMTLKVGFPLFVIAVAAVSLWIGGWFGRQSAPKPVAPTVDMVTKAELDALRANYEAELKRLADANALVRRIQQQYTRGVCLVHGIFQLRAADGSWLTARGGSDYAVEYTGSAFLANADGYLVTNRHVAVPWTGDDDIDQLVQKGYEPVLTHLTATFPGGEPIPVDPLATRLRQDDLDVAVLKVDRSRVEGLPVLPLKVGSVADEDQRAIVVGYPNGLAALLARSDGALIDELRQRAASMTEAIDELARRGGINPVITQGIVSNVQEHVIAYDASTTHGGSGGPVFGGGGEVIAVNYAIQHNFTGNNLGVPIRFAIELLPQ